MNTSAFGPGQRSVTCVAVYTSWCVTRGNLPPSLPVRLSDLVNNWQEPFIPLEEARLIDLQQGKSEPVPWQGPLLLSRQEILMLHEVPTGGVQPQREGASEMRIEKRSLTIRARVGPYQVEGVLHLPRLSDLETFLNRAAESFLPLTAASIAPPPESRLSTVRVPFALINRSRLIISGMESALPSED